MAHATQTGITRHSHCPEILQTQCHSWCLCGPFPFFSRGFFLSATVPHSVSSEVFHEWRHSKVFQEFQPLPYVSHASTRLLVGFLFEKLTSSLYLPTETTVKKYLLTSFQWVCVSQPCQCQKCLRCVFALHHKIFQAAV